MRVARFTSILVLASLLHGGDAGAQDADDDAIALALFTEGRRLVADNDIVHACEKFEAARSHASWLGIELNLADCYDRLGKTASAWVLFRKASDDADKLADPRASYARERAASLEPRLSRITIQQNPGDQTPGIQILFDRTPVAPAGLGVPLPVDPGEHLVDAIAAGHQPWSTRVIVETKASVDVTVPPLAAEPSPISSAALTLSPPMRRDRSRRTVVLSIGGLGVAAVGTSLVLGLSAKLNYDDAVSGHCDAALSCDPQGFDSIHQAKRRGNLATVVGGVGVAAIVTAAIVYLTAPTTEHNTLTVVPIAGSETVGISVQGRL